jgi:predicted ATPase/signal transduction histidine kinase/tRNA A-37 threonylcarbamoyl transferase component Bud32
MPIELNYQLLEVLYETNKTIIYRGYRKQDLQPVVIKLLKTHYSTLRNVARLKHEYEIIRGLEIAGIVKPYDMINSANGFALVLEDFYGKSLKEFVANNKLEIHDFLSIAIQLAETLGELHNHHIIHKDIKPQNIIFNPETGRVKITDFSIASFLLRENPKIMHPNSLEGTLAYMSPEQTGRMNRVIDYRTDFYSLGITFYELLTKQLPFQTQDVMELVHCHIAKIPVSPHELNQFVPIAVSKLVMKLLAKTAEDRYQNAYGLKADLEQCLVQWQATGTMLDFPLGQQDKSSQFHIPEKLYGRETEVATLMAAFERISQGSIEIMLVSGYSGIGKSSLVNEVHKPMVCKHGYFISGKFDQYKRDIPYTSLIQAFQQLVRQLLTEKEEIIEDWKAKILEALHPNSQVIIDVIPEVELIVGKQKPVPQLGTLEAQNRFNLVFQQFIHIFTNPQHPLVLFLDDLQWADPASIKLIQLLITDPDSQWLLVIGAYRDNEVSPTHPLILMLDEVHKMGVKVSNITLGNLQKKHVEQLIADTLNETEQSNQLAQLADLLFKKTQGNPFFLNQLLKALHQQNLFIFNFNKRKWLWDIEQIQAFGITNQTVIELMVNKIQKLPETTQQVLKLAACIGAEFPLNILAIVNQKSLKETTYDLWNALEEGLILSVNNDYQIPLVFTQIELEQFSWEQPKTAYQFLHDRVQQAAYSLIPENQKKLTHFKIGKLLLQNTTSEKIEDNLFEIVNQLNIGLDLINNQSEKYELAQLNLLAGKKAKTSTAYETALRYLKVGLELLTEDCWQNHYDLTLALHIEAVEVEYLNTHFEEAQKLTEIVFQKSKELLDRIKVYEIKMHFYFSQNQMREAIDIALQILSELGIFLPQEPEALSLATEKLQQELSSWRGEKIEDLQHLPTMTDPYKIAAMRILVTVTPPVFIAYPALFPLVSLMMLSLCIQYGNSALASYAYVEYSLLVLGIMGDIDSGYRFGRLALKLLDKFDSRELKAKVYVVFNFFVRHWKEHIKTTIEPLLEAFQSGLEVGDMEYACHAVCFYCGYVFFTGESLEVVSKNQCLYIDFIKNSKQTFQLYYSQIWYQFILKLQGKVADSDCLNSKDLDNEFKNLLLKTNNHMSLFSLYLVKTIFNYLFKNYPQAIANAELGMKYENILVGMMHIAQTNFYYSLSLLAQYPSLQPREQQETLKIVQTNQQKMKTWAESAPENYQHKYKLVEAEKARVLNQFIEAMEYYDQAIQGARKQQYIHEEALAYELAGQFYVALGRQEIAQTYLHKAHFCYSSWGATAKVQDLEERYPRFLVGASTRKIITPGTPETTIFTISADARILDATTVIKASLALSREIILENLLRQLMRIMMENAGAQKGFFIAKQNEQWLIEAERSENGEVTVLHSRPLDGSQIAISVINYVQRTRENLVINNATQEEKFSTDSYIVAHQPQSILCLPIIHQTKLTGILYLENNLTTGAFTSDRLEVLKVLTSQVSISIENACLYAREQEKSRQLEQSLQKLQQTQAQLVQTEKISSLGQLVAGISHEVNNPVGFITVNLEYLQKYIQNLIDLLELYQQLPNSSTKIQEKVEEIDLEFLLEDLPKMLTSMKIGTNRISEIMSSVRIFSRQDAYQKQPADIHEGLDSTLLILHHRLKASSERPAIQLVKEYGDLPLVECFAGQLNQVFMNLIANAIDAIDEYNKGRTFEEIQRHPNRIRIRTEMVDNTQIVIRIADNGVGITEEVKQQLFCPFFTTKSAGKGTGLGLSICHHIIVEKHGGQLSCLSAPGEGVEFVIQIPVRN